MRTFAVVLLVAAVAWSLRGKMEMLEAPPALDEGGIPASAIQAILKEVTRQKPSLYPLDTVGLQTDGNTMTGRFMFLDRSTNSGIQYDVKAQMLGDKQVKVIDMQTSVSASLEGPWKPYGKASYIKYKDVTGAVDAGISGVKNMLDTL